MKKTVELFVLGRFIDGKFHNYVRKGRNRSISGYDNLGAARRGLAHSKQSGDDIRIITASALFEIDAETGEAKAIVN